MKSQTIQIILLSILFLCASTKLQAQSDKKPEREQKTIGVGLQASFPVYGASIMINTQSNISIQGILGAFSTLKMYGGRVLYRFETKKNLQPYVYGLLGAWSYEGYKIGSGWSLEKTTETVFGFGGGGGVEYFFEGLPDLGFNAEVGFGSVKFKDIDYNFSAISFGAGMHYYF